MPGNSRKIPEAYLIALYYQKHSSIQKDSAMLYDTYYL